MKLPVAFHVTLGTTLPLDQLIKEELIPQVAVEL